MRVPYTASDWTPHGLPAGFRSFVRLAAAVAASLISEYGRAVAAWRRYDGMRCAARPTLVRTGVASADIAHRVIEEFYAGRRGGFAG
jgi:hypothetical protein